MSKKHENRFHLKLRWTVPIAAALIMGSVFLSLKARKDQEVYLPEPLRPASDIFNLDALPAMASDVNLYSEGNVISVVSGFVEITHVDGQAERVTTQSALVAGDRILVSDDGNAELVWFDGSIARLAAGTDVEIIQASYDAKNINKTKIGLWAERGKIWAKVVDLIDGESEFTIKSNNGIAGVRGTTFHYILEDGLPTAEVIEGTVFLKKADGVSAYGTSIGLTGGQSGSVKKDGTLEQRTLDSKKLKEPYYAQNLEKDRVADKKFQEANLAKIRQWAKPLPGDPGYPQKQQRIQAVLSKAKDPALLDALKTRAAKIKIYEAIALSDPSDIHETLRKVSDKIQKAEWPEAQTDEIQINLKNSLRGMERAIKPVEVSPPEEKWEPVDGRAQAEKEPEKKEALDNKTNLRPVPDQRKGSEAQVQTPPSAAIKPKPTKKASEPLSADMPEGTASQPRPIILPKETLPVPDLTPEERHKQVLKRIEANRENWSKRVEERLEKMETRNGNLEGANDEKDEKTETEKSENPDENAVPKPPTGDEIKETLTDTTQETEKEKPKGEERRGGAPSVKPKEDVPTTIPIDSTIVPDDSTIFPEAPLNLN